MSPVHPSGHPSLDKTSRTIPSRIEWVDAARFIAMLCIIIQHSAMSPGVKGINEAIFIASWVQFFFFLGGYFYGKKPATGLLDIKRALFFFFPYLIWNVLYLLINHIPELAAAWSSDGLTGGLEYFIFNGLGIGGVPQYRPMWFLRDFALFSLVAPLFMKCSLAVRWLITVFLLCFPTHYLIPLSTEFIVPSVQSLRIFCLGMALSPFSLKTAKQTLYASPGGLLLVTLAISAIWYLHPGHYGEVCTLLSIAGIGAAGILTCRYLPGLGSFMASFAPMIFLIYASHVLLITIVFKITIPLGFPTLPDWVWALIVIPFLFAFPCALYKVMKRHCPAALPYIAAARSRE